MPLSLILEKIPLAQAPTDSMCEVRFQILRSLCEPHIARNLLILPSELCCKRKTRNLQELSFQQAHCWRPEGSKIICVNLLAPHPSDCQWCKRKPKLCKKILIRYFLFLLTVSRNEINKGLALYFKWR